MEVVFLVALLYHTGRGSNYFPLGGGKQGPVKGLILRRLKEDRQILRSGDFVTRSPALGMPVRKTQQGRSCAKCDETFTHPGLSVRFPPGNDVASTVRWSLYH